MAQPRNPAPTTDLPDSGYVQAPQRRRVRQEPTPTPREQIPPSQRHDDDAEEPNRNSGIGAVGMLMTGDMDDDSDDDEPVPTSRARVPENATKHAVLLAAATQPRAPQPDIPLASPKPGYAAPVAALGLVRPKPAAILTQPQGRQPQHQGSAPEMSQVQELLLPSSQGYPSPSPSTPYSMPSTPHPLQAPITPITPIFARPTPSPAPRDVTFVRQDSIVRGNSEDTLLPRRGAKGDDFWRRFSMVVKEDDRKPPSEKQSNWLRKTQDGSSRLALWVWVVGIFLLLCIGGAVGLGWYFTHNESSQVDPKAVGGSANEGYNATSSALVAASAAANASTSLVPPSGASLHVSPTNTVQRREDLPAFSIPGPLVTPAVDPLSVAGHRYHERKKLNRMH